MLHKVAFIRLWRISRVGDRIGRSDILYAPDLPLKTREMASIATPNIILVHDHKHKYFTFHIVNVLVKLHRFILTFNILPSTTNKHMYMLVFC